MKNLYINEDLPNKNYYPIIDFNFENGICEISGESSMEDPFTFYEPILEWLNQYIQAKNKIIFNIKLVFFNTSSSRFVLRILDLLKEFINKGGEAKINWYYNKDDPDMKEEILEFKEELDLDINIIAITK